MSESATDDPEEIVAQLLSGTGLSAWFDQETVARNTGLSVPEAELGLSRLEDSGKVKREHGDGHIWFQWVGDG